MTDTKQTDRGYQLSLIVMISLLVLFIGMMALNFRKLGQEEALQRQILNHVSALRVQSQSIGKSALRAVTGNVQAFSEVEYARGQFLANVGQLQGQDMSAESGQVQMIVKLPNEAATAAVENISNVWKKMQGNVDRLLARRQGLVDLYGLNVTFNEQLNKLQALSEQAAARLISAKAPAAQINFVSHQQLLLERMRRNAAEVLNSGTDAAQAPEQFGKDAVRFGQELRGLMNGDRKLKIERVTDASARSKLGEIARGYTVLNGQVADYLKTFPALLEARESASDVIVDGDKMLVEAAGLQATLETEGQIGFFDARSITLPGSLVLGLLLVLGYVVYTRTQKQQIDADQQREETEEVNKRTQAAILTLLDEMSTLADGDLTAKATVTEEITGAIADSVNYAIDELRKLVATINTTSDQVARAARQTRATAINLAEASDHQAQQITSATQSISQMAGSIEQVSKAAQESSEVAKRSLDIAHKGSDTVQRTIMGMDNIREQIQETSKRIKRLGESSQEIGAIVGLINDIADQTNILSLNAAIQAAMAGEAGRGFAVVADEVQRLAERSTDATKQIEALIKTIQTDTNEAVHSMEQSTAGVVAGAKLAEDAGVALTEIETVSGRLFQLVTGISDASVQQTQSATEVANTVNVIQDITQQVSAGTSETAESIGNLTELANDLHDSVAGFKLPETDIEGFETMVGETIPELGAEAVLESDEEMVSLAASSGEEMDLMAELSELSDAMDAEPPTTEVIPTLVETESDDELSAAVLEELAAELDASSESGLDVDLGATQASK